MSKRIFAFVFAILIFFTMSVSASAFEIFFRSIEDDVRINEDKTGWRFTLYMTSPEKTEACVFIALYDENNRLMSLRPLMYKASGVENTDGKTKGVWWKGTRAPYNGNITTDIYPDTYPATLKLFCWSSQTSVYPITNCVTYVISNPPSSKAIIVKDMQGFLEKLTETEYIGNTADAVNILVQVGNEVYNKALALAPEEDLDIEALKTEYNSSRNQVSNIYHNLMSDLEQVEFENILAGAVKFYPALKELIMDIFNISI